MERETQILPTMKNIRDYVLQSKGDYGVHRVDATNGKGNSDFTDEEEEETQYDVEEVLATQNTHTLYCPNCKSCITRRVILKRNDEVLRPLSNDNIRPPNPEVSDKNRPFENDGDDSKMYYIFRCLSCFAFFIPKATRSLENTSQNRDDDAIMTNQNDLDPRFVINVQTGTQAITETNEQAHRWRIMCEILPAIVYGGLNEALASLAIVWSAAGANAATVNILCMGLANLVGGFSILSKNLWDMKNDSSYDESNPIKTALRNNFGLNTILAFLSYICFGVLPPLIYGLSFREDDNKDYKMAAVAAASVFCISLLAAGKAYAWRPRSYLKTISSYLLMAISASGISFIVGDLTYDLLKKFDILEVNAHEGSWSSF